MQIWGALGEIQGCEIYATGQNHPKPNWTELEFRRRIVSTPALLWAGPNELNY